MERVRLEDGKPYCNGFNIIASLEVEDIEEGCPEGWGDRSEVSSENEYDSNYGRYSAPGYLYHNDEVYGSEKVDSEVEYEGLGLSFDNFADMTQRSIDLNLHC